MVIIIFFSTKQNLLFSSQVQDYYLRTEYRIKSIPDYEPLLRMNLKKRTVLHQNGDERISPSYLSLKDSTTIHIL